MDIYKYAEEWSYMCDYYDFHTGYIYGIQEYARAKKLGLPTPRALYFGRDGIVVYCDGKPIDVVTNKEED